MAKPAAPICFGHQRQGFRQRVGECSLRPSLEGAQGSLELGHTARGGVLALDFLTSLWEPELRAIAKHANDNVRQLTGSGKTKRLTGKMLGARPH